MPTLLLNDLPEDLYNRLQQQAEADECTMADEVIRTLKKGLQFSETKAINATQHRLPDPPFLSEEISAPFDLPRPEPSFRVKVRPGGTRLPEPLRDELELPQ
jgi:hypothetical protein